MSITVTAAEVMSRLTRLRLHPRHLHQAEVTTQDLAEVVTRIQQAVRRDMWIEVFVTKESKNEIQNFENPHLYIFYT
jgi:hypothetical protein